MTLKIFDALRLEAPMPSMAASSCAREELVAVNLACDMVTRSAAERVSAALRWAMELISSEEAEVSSSEAACSEAPSARVCPEAETCEAEEAT